MSLWWLEPGWKETRCSQCGAMIWPEGDPDWGKCYTCFSAELEANRQAKEEHAQQHREQQ